MKKSLLATIFVVMASTAYAADEASKPPAISGLTGLETVEPIKANLSMFSSNKPVTVPKAWKFIGVSNGEKLNNNNLWFQDTDGSIYLIGGYNDGSSFIIQGNVQKLEAK